MIIPLQTLPMSTTSPLDKLADSFLGRLFMAWLSSMIAVLTIPFLFLANSILQPVVLRWTALAWLGLAVGMAGRRLLHRYPLLVQCFCAWVILLSGLVLANELTYGYVGFSPLFLTKPMLDWQIVQQIMVAVGVSCLVLFSQRRPRVWVGPEKQPRPQVQTPLPKVHGAKKKQLLKTEEAVISSNSSGVSRTPTIPWQPRLKNLGRSVHLWGRQAGQAASRSRQKARALWNRSQHSLHLRLGRPQRQVTLPESRLKIIAKPAAASWVHLVGEEEHRCPYCLDLVEPDDPRGVKICPVCHTYHHADCWAVTGVCQVPHHHE